MAKRRKKRRRRGRRRSSVSPVALLAILLGLFLVAGFAVLISTAKPGSQKALCTLLLDRTSSASSSGTTELYLKLAKGTVAECAQAEGTLTVWAFGGSGAKNEVVGTFPLYGAGTNKPLRDRSMSQNEHKANSAIEKVLTGGTGGAAQGSDIVSAINQAASTMATQGQGAKKYMVVLTDGMQLTDNVSVKSLDSITTDPALLVGDALAVNPRFDLDGVNVSLLGVSGGQISSTGEKLPNWFEQKVGQFWKELVHKGHGSVCAYQADQANGSILLNCGA